MEQMYNVSSNPHIRDKMTTSRIMQLVVIALLPTTLFGIWNFGVHALLVVLATVASSVLLQGSMGGLVFRGIGIVRAKANVAMTNLTYNIARLTQIYRYHKEWITA